MRNEEVSLHPPLPPAEGVQRVPVPVRSVCGSVRPAAVVSCHVMSDNRAYTQVIASKDLPACHMECRNFAPNEAIKAPRPRWRHEHFLQPHYELANQGR